MRTYNLFVRDSAKDNWPTEPVEVINDSDKAAFEKVNWKLGWTKYRYVIRNVDANPRSECNSSTGQASDFGTVRA